jgi:hypothetical protein
MVYSSSLSYGSGIGTGSGEDGGMSRIGNLTIVASTLVANSSSEGSGIGTGPGTALGHSVICNLTILDSGAVAESCSNGCGVGTGYACNGVSMINSLRIVHSVVEASSLSYGSGIGTGYWESDGISTVEVLSILDSTVRSNGSSTINVSSILISLSSLTFVTSDAPLFATSPSNNGSFDLVIGYRQETLEGAEHLSSSEAPFLHIGNLSVPDRDSGSLEFYIRRTDFEQCFDDAFGRIRSVIIKGPEQCEYSFPGSFDGVSGYFASNCTTDFAVDSNDSFINVLVFESPGRGCPLIPTLSILSSDYPSTNANLQLSDDVVSFNFGLSDRLIQTLNILSSDYHSTIAIFQHSDDFVSFNVDPSDRLIQTLSILSSDYHSTTGIFQQWTDLISFQFDLSYARHSSESPPASTDGASFGSSQLFAQSTRAARDLSGELLSFDVIDSLNTPFSNAVIATELSLHLVKSLGFELSDQASASNIMNDSVGVGIIDTNGFGISEQRDSLLNQAGESTLVWIGIGSSLAAILLGLPAIIFLLGCRRLSFSSATSLPESEIEWFTDSLSSFTEPDLLLSEQNALSSRVSIE